MATTFPMDLEFTRIPIATQKDFTATTCKKYCDIINTLHPEKSFKKRKYLRVSEMHNRHFRYN